LEAFHTASSGSAYFKVQCEAGEKQLLAAPEYWLSSPQHVSAAFDALSAKTLALEKAKRAAERRKDIYAAKQLGTAKRKRALFATGADADADDEVKELEIETDEYKERPDEPEFAEAADY
jgi:prophage DNA circulation protein